VLENCRLQHPGPQRSDAGNGGGGGDGGGSAAAVASMHVKVTPLAHHPFAAFAHV